MAFTTKVRFSVNRCLQRFNLRIETLTVEKLERKRLAMLEEKNYFARPVFTLPRAFESMTVSQFLEELDSYAARFNDFESLAHNEVGYTFDNNYFTSPDAEVLYGMVRKYKPETFVEVGSGNSTRIVRQAIIDGKLNTRLISIDPAPRLEVEGFSDELHRRPVEDLENTVLLSSLKAGDILFIDSSHEIKTGNDVVFLYLDILPRLRPGVVIQLHDIFLPYEYPREWVIENQWAWNEQYLVQSILMFSDSIEVLWAGHYLQRTRPDFGQYFPRLNGRVAKSLWLRKTK